MKYSEENYLDENGEPDIQSLVNDMLADLEEIRESDPIYYKNRMNEIRGVLRAMVKHSQIYPGDSLSKLASIIAINTN